VCRGCVANSECESGVCEPAGTCAAPDSVVYVAPTGIDQGPCSMAMPCQTVTYGWSQLDDTKTTLYLNPGAYLIAGALAATGTRAIVGPALGIASIEHSGATQLAIVAMPGSTLSLRDVTFFDRVACNGGALEAIRVKATPSASYGFDLYNGCTATLADTDVTGGESIGVYSNGMLSMVRMEIEGNGGNGVHADGGSLSISDSDIEANNGLGVFAQNTDVTIVRTTLRSNLIGGAELRLGVFDLVNNFIDHNGNSSANLCGGLYLQQPATGSRVEFNTIAFNVGDTAAGSYGGFYCDPSLTAPNNIIYNNARGSDTTTPTSQVGGGCSVGNSLVLDGMFGPDELGFVRPNSTPFDLHIGVATSPAVGAAQPSTIFEDIDGQIRPNQGASDLGADEFYP
jgi:hypothetical protein